MRMRRAARTDENHGAVVDALRARGWSVLDLSRVGGGCPDLLVARNGRTLLVEVKRPPGPRGGMSHRGFTPDQFEFLREWKGQVAVVRSVADVDALEQAIRA